MRRAATVTLTTLFFGVFMAGAGNAPTVAQEPLPLKLRFALYSEATQTRTALAADGFEVSDITLDAGAWSLRTNAGVGEWADTKLGTTDCSSQALGPGRARTSCVTYSEAKTEREAMTRDGWTCPPRNRFNDETKKWEFECRKS
jgi:hypothetical protein